MDGDRKKRWRGLTCATNWSGSYQDGLPVSGHELRIVNELARAGSSNHQLLLRMRLRGATIMGTEAGELLVQEYQLARQLITAPRASPARAQANRPWPARSLSAATATLGHGSTAP